MTFCLLAASIHPLDVVAGVTIAVGLSFFVAGFRMLARKRSLMAIPVCTIRDASMGLVEISGLAAGPRSISAPISGKPCFLYQTIAWQQCAGNQKEWEKVADETLHVPFFLVDSTGKLLVEPLGGDLDLNYDFHQEYDKAYFTSDLDSMPPRISVFLARHGVSPSRSLRVEERLIQSDDSLVVVGTLAKNPGIVVRQVTPDDKGPANPSNGQEHKTTAVPEVIRLSSGPMPTSTRDMSQQQKIAAALTRAGIKRPEAWAAAGVPYGDSSQAVAVQNTSQVASFKDDGKAISSSIADEPPAADRSDLDLPASMVLMKANNDSAFVISFRSQHEYLSGLAWKSAAMIWGGGAAVLAGAYVLLSGM